MTPEPTAIGRTPTSLDSEGAALAARGVLNIFAEAVFAQQTPVNFTVEFAIRGKKEHWVVNYSDILEGAEQWKAKGTLTTLDGRHVVFDSLYGSSCLKQMQPQEGQWVYHEHQGWSSTNSPDTFEPPTPWTFLWTKPAPEWRLVGYTDAEAILTHDPFANGLTFTVYVDKKTHLVNREEISLSDGLPNSFAEYSRYGGADVSGVHNSRSDCKSRNN